MTILILLQGLLEFPLRQLSGLSYVCIPLFLHQQVVAHHDTFLLRPLMLAFHFQLTKFLFYQILQDLYLLLYSHFPFLISFLIFIVQYLQLCQFFPKKDQYLTFQNVRRQQLVNIWASLNQAY